MKKKHLRVIRDIQDAIPRELLMRLTKKEMQAPTMKKVFELALTKPDSEVSPRQKRAIKAVLDSGRFDREVEVLDHEVEKEIDAIYEVEIAKAVKLGRLPKEAPQLKSLQNKGTQYARRQEKRLRAEFGAEDSDVVDEAKDDENNANGDPARPSNRSFIPPVVG